jgi:hypothetical protein
MRQDARESRRVGRDFAEFAEPEGKCDGRKAICRMAVSRGRKTGHPRGDALPPWKRRSGRVPSVSAVREREIFIFMGAIVAEWVCQIPSHPLPS